MKKLILISGMLFLLGCTQNYEPPSWKNDVGSYPSEPINHDIPALERDVEQKQIFK